MKFLSFALFCALFSTTAFAETYQATEALMSADREGPHKGIAQHVIGLKNGAVVPGYIAFAQDGCTLTFPQGKVAVIGKGEKLTETRAFTVRPLSRENCLEWDNSTGDDVCYKYGEPFTDLILEGELSRDNGEKAAVFCRVYEQSDTRSAYAQWYQSYGGLLRSL